MKNTPLYLLVAALAALFLNGSSLASLPLPSFLSSAPENPPEVVKHVDLKKFSGLWHEIARFPNPWQEGCMNTRSIYTIKPDGVIEVTNLCDQHGEEKKLSGTVEVVDPGTNAKLKVTFLWPLSGDYWVVILDPAYKYAVISEPDREKLWILSREKALPERTYKEIVKKLAANGYDTTRLIKSAP